MNSLELSVLWPAFIAGLLVLSTHVPLGIDVLKRGIIFIDLAIAQIAGLGALASTLILDEKVHEMEWIVQLASLLAALSGALILTWTEKRFPDIQEALIGCLFVFSASLALLLLGQNPHGSEHIKDLLAGQILWVSTGQLVFVAVLSAVVLAAWFVLKEWLNRFGFYSLFALSVTASVQLVGVYLVFACLILPALASRHTSENKRLFIAYGIGMTGLVSGLALSACFDLATGPAIVCTMFVIAMTGLLIKRTTVSIQE